MLFADIDKTTIQRFFHGALVPTGFRQMEAKRARYSNMLTRQPDTLRLARLAAGRNVALGACPGQKAMSVLAAKSQPLAGQGHSPK